MGERAHFLGEFDHVVRVEKIPKSVVSDVIVSQKMAESPCSSNVMHWLNKDYALEHAGYFAFANEEGYGVRTQSQIMHRAFIIEADPDAYFDGYGTAYGQVVGKGNGLSTLAVIKRSQNAIEAERRNALISFQDPHGFFGLVHAKQDMEVSDQFAAYGGRVSRSLAILVLDHIKFRDWAEVYLGRSSYPCLEMLQRVENNGDTAAILVRLFAADRLAELSLGDVRGFFASDKARARAGALLAREASAMGETAFVDKFRLNEYEGFKTKPLVQRLSAVAKGWSDPELVAFFAAYFNLWNKGVFKRLSTDRYGGQLAVDLDTRNVDALGFWYDFETSVMDVSQYNGFINYCDSLYFPKALSLGKNADEVSKKAYFEIDRLRRRSAF